MKSRFFAKLCLILTLSLLFSSLPVKASSVQDQSKPIFGLTADDVVEKYNQLTDQQKDQVLRSLGNTSIFANSLFGNIFNSTFGVLDDAIEKIGDLFFQANGVVYKLGSSALAWVSRLIDKVFNNDLSDLNISQPVVDDFYLNTRNLTYIKQPIFTNPNIISSVPSYSWSYILPLPTDSYDYVFFDNVAGSLYCQISRSNILSPEYFGPIVNLDSGYITFGSVKFHTVSDYWVVDRVHFLTAFNFSLFIPSSSQPLVWDSYPYYATGDFLTINNVNLSNYNVLLSSFLKDNFYFCNQFAIIKDSVLDVFEISTEPEYFNITNNTYYNYIYNIPDQTPLNVINIVSNTAIDYSPVNNIAYYLPDQYNIEQNFSVVNNYYISSGSAITTQGAIDVTLVSPSVIDVRITNPEDLKDQVENNYIDNITRNFNINFGDLNIEPDINIGIDSGLDDIDVTVPTSSSILGNFVGSMPTDLSALIFTFLGFAFIVAVLYHGSN